MKKIKRILASFMVAVMVLTAAPLSGFVGLELPNIFDIFASAESYSGTCGENLTWTFDTETSELSIDGTSAMNDYISNNRPWEAYQYAIKTVIIGDGVTTIGNNAFRYCTSLASVTIPDSVTTIGDVAFYGCTSLTSIAIPDSVTTIGADAFSSCDNLTSITIPDSVTTIGDHAFSSCDSLTSITIPDSVTTIGDSAFWLCISLTSITIPESVTTIGEYVFGCCDSLTSITIPDSVTTIGDDAFYDCNSLTSVTIGNSVTTIGKGAFRYCTSLTSVTIPDSVTIIGDDAFYHCYGLTSVTIGNSVTTIGDCVFENCDSLTNVTIGNSVTTIEKGAFRYCTSLTSVTIPDSVTIIGDEAFAYCTGLTNIEVDAGNQHYCSDSFGALYNKDKTELIQYSISNERTAFVIPDSVTIIGDYAFYGCDSLTSITIPDSVSTIGDYAFYDCNSLTSVTIGNSVTTIGDVAFADCTSLTNIEVSADNEYYRSDSFGELYNKNRTELIQYPIGNSRTSFAIPHSVTTIVEEAFSWCHSLTSVTIPDSVTTIGELAFYYCTSLTDVYYSGTEEEWNEIAIGRYNAPLLNATIHYNYIEDDGISGTCGENLTWTFDTETSKLSIDGTGTMYHYYYLGNRPWETYVELIETVVIGPSVTTIGERSFEGCTSLTSVIIGGGVRIIDYGAFHNCGNLADIYYSGNKEEWDAISINGVENAEELEDVTIHYVENDFKSGDIIEFGSYPQSEVLDKDLLSKLNAISFEWESYGYYQNMDPYDIKCTGPHDFMKFADVEYKGEKYRAVKLDGFRSDSTYHAYSKYFEGYQSINGYETDKVYWFKYEPLQWEVLDPETGLVSCTTLIDAQPFNNFQEEKDGEFYSDGTYTNLANDYTTSSIRKWLNSDFYNIAFSSEEKTAINQTKITNNAYDSENSNYNYPDVTDKVFLLSYDDLCNEDYGFSPDRSKEIPERTETGTDYAYCQGLYVYGSVDSTDDLEEYFGNSYYWLRSAGDEYSFYSCIGTYAGTIAWSGNVSYTFFGVKPTLTVDLTGFETAESSVSIDGQLKSIAIGESIELEIKVDYGIVQTEGTVWTTSNPDIVNMTVDPKGETVTLTGAKKGKTTITATTPKGHTATYTVNVYQPVSGIVLNKNSTTIALGKTEQLIATVFPDDADFKNVYWDVEDFEIATVVDGLVTAHDVGETTVTVRTEDGKYTATCKITVVKPVTGVKLNQTNLSLVKGKTAQLKETVSPDDATNKAVTWSSNNLLVAIVDSNGKITAISTGTATITVKTKDGSYTSSCKVTVINQPVTGVKLNKTSATVIKGNTLQLTATLSPSNAYNKNVTWSSSNTSVASVDSKGKVTAKSVGNATITVKTVDGGYTSKCTITVKNETISVTSVSLSKTKTSIFVGKTETLTAKIKPSNATNKNVTWSSSNTSVAKVDSNGKITAVAKGTATITAKTKDGNKTATCQITVKKYNENVEKKGTFILGDKNYNQQVTFDANWLQEYSYDYNHDLAQFCSLVSLLTYGNMSEIKNSLDSIGFSTNDKGIKKYWPEKKDTTYDKNCYVITKKSYTIEGKEQTVVMVMLRGTYGNEWYSNFDPGTGDTHQYFKKAKDFVKGDLIEYLKDNGLYNKDNVKLIITGHSRGAAVANLLAADLVTTTGVPQSYDTFTYTFATPNVTNKSERSKEIYKNIFNFVNPEDFVAKCVPAQWKYGRYGVTLTLPSKTNESKSSYKTYYNNMNSVFRKYMGRDYQPYSNGEEAVYKVVNKLTSTVPTINDFYSKKMKNTYATKMTPYEFFRDTLCPIVSGTADKSSITCAALYCYSATFDPIACDTYEQVVKFFIGNEALGILSEVVNDAINSTYFYKKLDVFVDYTFANRYFQDAHLAETYASYVTSMCYDQAYTWAKGTYRKGYKGTVNCPVDVEVYNVDTGELVGRIVDNQVDEEVASRENAIVMSVDGDSKSYWLPSSGNYEVKLIGNAEGIMNHTVSVVNEEIGEIGRINFEDIPVYEGFEMCGEYIEDEADLKSLYLTTELGETISPTEYIDDFDANKVSVNTTIEGTGSVTGELSVIKGDYVSLLAETDENNSFLGWYIGSKLICEDKEYSFVAKENITLVAKFTNVSVDVSGINIKEESLNLNLTGDNSLALLNYNILPQNVTDKSVIWYSSDESIVKVNEFGVIEAVGLGTAQVFATTSDGSFADSCTVTVAPRLFNITWNISGVESTQAVLEGSAIAVPDEPKLKGFTFVSWDSEIPSVMPDHDLYFTAQFVPFTGKVNSVSIGNISINYKESATIVPVINADGGVEYTVTYSSSNPSVASVDANGKVSTGKTGSATITVTVTDEYGNTVSNTCNVEVKYTWWQWIIVIVLFGWIWY